MLTVAHMLLHLWYAVQVTYHVLMENLLLAIGAHCQMVLPYLSDLLLVYM